MSIHSFMNQIKYFRKFCKKFLQPYYDNIISHKAL